LKKRNKKERARYDIKIGAKDADARVSPTDMAGTIEFPFALLMSAAESEKERFSDELPGVSTVPGDLGGSGLYKDVCLCNASSFFGLRSWDCSLIVLNMRLVCERERERWAEQRRGGEREKK
jgi:hypothetical protein